MAQPVASSQPKLATGCRWREQNGDKVVLYPEGMIRLQGTGLAVLELCDGQRTVEDIVQALTARYGQADPQKVREDVSAFLENLQKKRIVDY